MLVAMMVSAAVAKHLMTKERMEALIELQVVAGLGFCLRVLQLLWMNVRAAITLERLAVFEEADDEVGGQVGRPGGDEVDGSGWDIVQG